MSAMIATLPSNALFLVLEGQIPSGKNQQQIIVRQGRVMKFPNARFKRWRDSAWQQIQRQRGKWLTLKTPARVFAKYWPGDLLRRDVPGMMDALSHLLEFCPVCRKKNKTCNIPFVQDDSLLVSWHWDRMTLDRARPRLEVTLCPIES